MIRTSIWDKLGILSALLYLMLSPSSCPAQDRDIALQWDNLGDLDGSRSYRAIWAMALNADNSVPILKSKLQPVVGDRKVIEALIRDLDSDRFAVRDKAIGQLERFGQTAEGALRQAITGSPSIERKRRIELLLEKIRVQGDDPAYLRRVRALEVLELIGTPDALTLLQHLASGNADAQWTQMARASSDRLIARSRPSRKIPAAKIDAFGDAVPPGALARLGTVRMQNADLAALTSDGKSLVGVTANALHMWDASSGREVAGFPLAKVWKFPRAIAISPDGKLLAVLLNSGYSFDICELPSGKSICQFQSEGQIVWPCEYRIAFSRDSKTFVFANQKGLQIWDVASNKKVREFACGTGTFSVLVVSPDGKRLATCTQAGELQVWDIATGQVIQKLAAKYFGRHAVFSMDGATLAANSSRNSLRLWDVAGGKLVRELSLSDPEQTGPISTFAFSPDGNALAVCTPTRDGHGPQELQFWDLRTQSEKPRIVAPPRGIGWLEGYSNDGKSIVWRIGSSYCLLDSTTGKDRHDWPNRGGMSAVVYSPDSAIIATGCHDGSICLWDAVSFKPLRTMVGHRYPVSSVTFSPNSKLLLSCGGYKEPAVLWDVATGKKKSELDDDPNIIPGVYWGAFSLDSKSIFTSGNSIKRGVWDAATGKRLRDWTGDRNSTWSVVFSPDMRFVSTGVRSVTVSALNTEFAKHRFDTKGEMVTSAFSPDSRTLAALINWDDIILWETLTGRERARFPNGQVSHQGRIVFSPNGRLLAVANPSHLLNGFELRDLAKGEKLGPIVGHRDMVVGVAFSPDGGHMATASRDGTVLIREVPCQ